MTHHGDRMMQMLVGLELGVILIGVITMFIISWENALRALELAGIIVLVILFIRMAIKGTNEE